jgi:GTP 3',8-cyclase
VPDLDTLSLQDALNRPLRDLRISVTDKCNLRCTYCMPSDRYGEHYVFLQRSELLTFEEIARIARLASEVGVRKLRLTGGEPLLRKDLPELVAMLAHISGIEDIALTTNAILLPTLAKSLRDAGLQRVTVSLDSLDDATFSRLSGARGSVAAVLEGIDAAEQAGFGRLKVNCVVQRGVNEQSALALAAHFRGTGHIVRFIEYMDVGTCNGWKLDQVVPSRELHDMIHAAYPLRASDPGYHGEVAERYLYEDGAGEIGFISSVSRPFCGDCTRLRLSADGSLYTCLFATRGTDLRGPLRAGASDEALKTLFAHLWQRRSDRYSEQRAALNNGAAKAPKIEMYHIGG